MNSTDYSYLSNSDSENEIEQNYSYDTTEDRPDNDEYNEFDHLDQHHHPQHHHHHNQIRLHHHHNLHSQNHTTDSSQHNYNEQTTSTSSSSSSDQTNSIIRHLSSQTDTLVATAVNHDLRELQKHQLQQQQPNYQFDHQYHQPSYHQVSTQYENGNLALHIDTSNTFNRHESTDSNFSPITHLPVSHRNFYVNNSNNTVKFV